MSSYLEGSFTVNKSTYDDCFGYLTSISVHPTYATFYKMVVDIYSDENKTTNVYSQSSMLLPVISDESDDDREIRALNQFKGMMAPGMSVVTETVTATTDTSTETTDSTDTTTTTTDTATASTDTASSDATAATTSS